MDKICRNCTHWDNRPEDGMDIFTGYCTIHERLKNAKFTCDSFEKKVKRSSDAYLTEKFEEEGGDFEGDDEYSS